MDLLRSLQFVPGNRGDMLEKAKRFNADVLVADLEDSVPPSEKAVARDMVSQIGPTLADFGQKIMVRVNSFGTGLTKEDLFAVVEEAWRVSEIAGHSIVMVEALLPGQELRLRAKVPLAHHEGLVARLPALLGDCDLIWMQTEEPVGLAIGIYAHVETRPLGISTGQEGRPRRRTYGGRCMEVGEANALFGQPVQVRCLDLGRPVAGNVRVSEIVRQEKHEIGLG